MPEIEERSHGPFHWFSGQSLDRLTEELDEVRGQPGARLEVYQNGPHMIFRVFSETYQGPPINESHICPIDCP